MATHIGLEIIAQNQGLTKNWGACALLCNQASVDQNYQHSIDILGRILGKNLTCLFGPQHGLAGTVQDNMIETPHVQDPRTGLTIYSLYSETREPAPEMMEGLDTLIIDIQLSGCRIYTFKATILACMKAARKSHTRVVILDRPNPLGGLIVEGRVSEEGYRSFVSPDEIPMRHGLTPGEFANYVNRLVGCELEVVRLKDWEASENWQSTGRPWVLTSPNLPTLDPLFVYPGMVLFEGCNVSEGRGTGLPFQLIGSPWIRDSKKLIERIRELSAGHRGVSLRPASFCPTSGKWQGRDCQGLQIHIQSPDEIRSLGLAQAMIRAFSELSEGMFGFRQPPYEYEYDRLPMDMIVGAAKSDVKLSTLDPFDPYWNEGISNFVSQVKPYLLYPRGKTRGKIFSGDYHHSH